MEYNPHIVFLGYMSENIARNVNVFRPFYSRWYRHAIFTKPRFKVKDGALVLLENPLTTFEDYEYFLHNETEVLAKLGENDYHYQIAYTKGIFDSLPSVRFVKISWWVLKARVLFDPIFNVAGMYNVKSEAYEVTSKIFDVFYRRVLENGALPIIVVFPDKPHDQWRSRKKEERRYTPLLNEFRAKGYSFIDALAALEPYESHSTVDEFVADGWGHIAPLGNRIIAEYIFTQLRNRGYLNLEKLEEVIQAEQVRLEIRR